MGWTSEHQSDTSAKGRKAVLDAQFTWGENKVLKSAMVGNTYYAAVYYKAKDGTTGVTAVVALTSVDNRDYFNFAYKTMDETVGPNGYECPVGILDLLTDIDSECANEWRQKNRENIEKKKQMAKIQNQFAVGDRIRTKLWYDKERILTLSLYRGKKTWVDWASHTKFAKKDVFRYPFTRVDNNADATITKGGEHA